MTIQTYGDLQNAVADYSNRRDLTAQIPDFINKVHIRVQEYVGPLAALNLSTDTNALLQYDPYVYLHGALSEVANYLRDDTLDQEYTPKYESRLAELAMTGFGQLQVGSNTFVPAPQYGYGWCLPWTSNGCVS